MVVDTGCTVSLKVKPENQISMDDLNHNASPKELDSLGCLWKIHS